MSEAGRRFPRAPVSLEVEYRTSTAFLVAYSLNLSKGGLFIETDKPLPTGTTIKLRFRVAGSAEPIETEGAVIWVRDRPGIDGPCGMGVAFVQLEARYGQVIDGIVSRFDGVTMLVGSTVNATRSLVARYLRGMMSCQVLEISGPEELPTSPLIDLAVVDFAQAPDVAERIIAAARAISADVPVIGLAPGIFELKDRAARAGAFEVLGSPPPYTELYRTVLGAFSRLVRLTTTRT